MLYIKDDYRYTSIKRSSWPRQYRTNRLTELVMFVMMSFWQWELIHCFMHIMWLTFGFQRHLIFCDQSKKSSFYSSKSAFHSKVETVKKIEKYSWDICHPDVRYYISFWCTYSKDCSDKSNHPRLAIWTVCRHPAYVFLQQTDIVLARIVREKFIHNYN